MLLFSARLPLAASSRASSYLSSFRHRLAIAALFLVCRARCYTHRAADMDTVDTSTRLSELRRLMKERNIDVYS